ncbi:hypothetical protein [Streptomyces kronopolitis]|uniref:hypothetical protein n=1 Tax=Streptomyces kronopolitis TaxID=1612435 RepID=UPI003D953E4F
MHQLASAPPGPTHPPEPAMADIVTIPAETARAFTDTWCGKLTSDVAAALNCVEVETLAELLRAPADGDEARRGALPGPGARRGVSRRRWLPLHPRRPHRHQGITTMTEPAYSLSQAAKNVRQFNPRDAQGDHR